VYRAGHHQLHLKFVRKRRVLPNEFGEFEVLGLGQSVFQKTAQQGAESIGLG